MLAIIYPSGMVTSMRADDDHGAGLNRGDRAVAVDDELRDGQRNIGFARDSAEIDHDAQELLIKAAQRDQLRAALTVSGNLIVGNQRDIAAVLEG